MSWLNSHIRAQFLCRGSILTSWLNSHAVAQFSCCIPILLLWLMSWFNSHVLAQFPCFGSILSSRLNSHILILAQFSCCGSIFKTSNHGFKEKLHNNSLNRGFNFQTGVLFFSAFEPSFYWLMHNKCLTPSLKVETVVWENETLKEFEP